MATLSYKFRLFPTRKQSKKIDETFENCLFLYNHFLKEKKDSWENDKKNISLYDQLNTLPNLKKVYPKLKQVHSQVLQNVGVRLDLAFQAFFRRVKHGENPGYPRFKSERQYSSITYPSFNNGISLDKTLFLSKIGEICIKQHRKIEGTPKCATISKTKTGKYFVSIVCIDVKTEKLVENDKKIGIDVGVESFLTFNDGNKIANPRFFETDQKALGKAQSKKNQAKDEKNWDNYRKHPKTG